MKRSVRPTILLLGMGGALCWLLLRAPTSSDPAEDALEATVPRRGETEARQSEGGAVRRESSSSRQLLREPLPGGAGEHSVGTGHIRPPSFRGTVVGPGDRPAVPARVTMLGVLSSASTVLKDGRPGLRMEARTDSRGTFELPALEGRWLATELELTLAVHAEGSTPLVWRGLVASRGRTRELGTLALRPAGKVAGIVRDPDGAPVAGATVTSVPEEESDRFRHETRPLAPPPPEEQALSDVDGRFVLSRVAAGRNRLQAEVSGMPPGFSRPLTLRPGQEIRDVEIRLPQAVSLHGEVGGESGVALAGARVTVSSPGMPSAAAIVGEDGRFAVSIPRGLPAISLHAFAPGHLPGSLRVRLDRSSTPVRIRLVACPEISGVVRDERGRPIDGARVLAVPYARAHGRLHRDLDPWGLARAVTGKGGRFALAPSFERTPETRLAVVVSAAGFLPAMSGPLDLERKGDDLPARVVVELESAGVVRGRVQTPTGVAATGATVHLSRIREGSAKRAPSGPETSSRAVPFAVAFAEVNSAYAFDAVPPGRYRLVARHPGFSPSSASIVTVERSPCEQMLTLRAEAGLHGRVSGADGMAESFGILAQSAGERLQASLSDDGEFELRGLVPGSYRVSLMELARDSVDSLMRWGTEAALPAREGVIVREGKDALCDLTIALEQRGSIRGTIRSPDGDLPPRLVVYVVPRRPDGSVRGGPWREVAARTRSARVDEDGGYHVSLLPPGDYWAVVARADAWPRGLFQRRMRDQSARGPCGLTRHSVHVDAGGERVRDFALSLGTLAGRALPPPELPPGTPLVGIGHLLPARSVDGAAERTFPVYRDGTFSVFDLPAGEWMLRIDGRGYRTAPTLIEIPGGGDARVVTPTTLG